MIAFATCSALCFFDWRLQTAPLIDDNCLVWFLNGCQSPRSCHLPPDESVWHPFLWKAWLFLSKQTIPCWDVLISHNLFFPNFQKNILFNSPVKMTASRERDKWDQRPESGSANASSCWSVEALVFWQGTLWHWWNEMNACVLVFPVL